jgi:hypothetical protein
LLWLYAVTDAAALDVPAPRMGGSRVELVRAEGLAAVVEILERAPVAEPDLLARHDAAVREIAATVDAILPARFGQTAADARELERTLAERRDALAAGLDRVRGCVQVTTRLVREDARVAEAGPDVSPGSSDSLGPGRRYLARRRAETGTPILDGLRERLLPLARTTRSRRGPEPAIASAYWLVERDRAGELVRAAGAWPAPPGTRLAISGPFPPWAFAEGLP